jgi:hypothetical protein
VPKLPEQQNNKRLQRGPLKLLPLHKLLLIKLRLKPKLRLMLRRKLKHRPKPMRQLRLKQMPEPLRPPE